MKTLILGLLLLSSNAFAVARPIYGDSISSSDRTRTWFFPVGSDTFAGLSSTQTFTNKIIDGASNTLSVRLDDLPNQNDSTVLANTSGSSGKPAATTRDTLLDKFFGAVNGTYNLIRTGGAWQVTPASTSITYTGVTSSVKTPGATDRYLQMTGNSITPAAGKWQLFCSIECGNNGSGPSYAECSGKWSTANGADDNNQPASITAEYGNTNFQRFNYGSTGGSANTFHPTLSPVVVNANGSTAYYCVPFESASSPSNARVTTFITAVRLQ